MLGKPMKTYLRKATNSVVVIPALNTATIPMLSDSDNDRNESINMFDDTFDRVRKTAKPVWQPVAPVDNDSSDFSSSSRSSEVKLIPIPAPEYVASLEPGNKNRPRRKAKLARKGKGGNKISKVTFRSQMKKRVAAVEIDSSEEEEKKTSSLTKIAVSEKRYSDPCDIDSSSKEKLGNEMPDTSLVKFESDNFKMFSSQITTRKRRKSVSMRNLDRRWTNTGNDVNKSTPKRIKRKTRNSSPEKSVSKIIKEEKADEGKSNESELVISISPIKECWVSLVRLQLKEKLDAKHGANHKDSSHSINQPESIIVSELSEHEQSVQNQSIGSPFRELLAPKTGNIAQSDSAVSPSMFSFEEQSIVNEPEQHPAKQVNSSKNQSESSIIERFHDQNSGSITQRSSAVHKITPCSVRLQRLRKPSIGIVMDYSISQVNEPLVSSTPLVSRVKAVPVKLKDTIERMLLTPCNYMAEDDHQVEKGSFVLTESTEERNSRTSFKQDSSVDVSRASEITLGVFEKDKVDAVDEPSDLVSSASDKENNPQKDQSDFIDGVVSTSYEYIVASPPMFNDDDEASQNKENKSSERRVNDASCNQSSLDSSYSMSSLIFEDDDDHSPKKEETVNCNEPKDSIIDRTPEKPRKSSQAVVLTRPYNSTRVTQRHNKQRNVLSSQLSAINENGSRRIATVVEENDEGDSAVAEESEMKTGIGEAVREAEVSLQGTKHMFLKPGKSWARSLSILNNIQRKEDIEALATSKGRNWRESVISVLNMQNQGAVQSCLLKNEDNKDGRASHRINNNNSDKSLSSNRFSVQLANPERLTRRISIRVVPDNQRIKSIDKQIYDSSFLKAYGISTGKDRQTLVKKSIAPLRKTSNTFRASRVEAKSSNSSNAARNVVLRRCNQKDSQPFSQFYSEDYLSYCRKIGEGLYGEVFLFDKDNEKSVIKIIPIEGSKLVNGEPQKKFDEILSEIVIAKELHDLRVNEVYRTDGFVEVKNIRCLKGMYPEKLVKLWTLYDDEQKSDNECPSMFDENQLYIALELGHGGKNLEEFVFQNASEAYSSFIQTALSLAVAEKSLDFEHRDLHWGNILISRTNNKEVIYKLNNEKITYACKGVNVSIIDFTLSRMSYEGCCIFNDLALDPSLFDAVGEYQFEIYRLMKMNVNNNWQKFEPYTNILWLHYTLDKMITAARYKRKETKIHNTHIEKLKELKSIILDYDSTFDFVTTCEAVRDVLKIS